MHYEKGTASLTNGMQTLDMQTQKKRGNFNKICAGFSISSVLIFAKTVKWSQIGGKKNKNKKTDGIPIVILGNERFTNLISN